MSSSYMIFTLMYLCEDITAHFLLLVQLRRERIAERIRALQELVPCVNKV